MAKRRDRLPPPPLLAQSPQPQALTVKHHSENQGSCLVTVSFSFTFLSHLCMHWSMLEQGLGLIPGIIYKRKVLET